MTTLFNLLSSLPVALVIFLFLFPLLVLGPYTGRERLTECIFVKEEDIEGRD